MKTPYFYFNNKMVVSANALYRADDFLKNDNIITYYAYESSKKAGKFSIIKNGCKGSSPLIDFESIEYSLQQKIIRTYGDPYKIVQRKRIEEVIKNDTEAFRFFSGFVKDDGRMHGQTANNNAEKINDQAKVWLIARWGDSIKQCPSYSVLLDEYNEKANRLLWKPLKHVQTLRNYLTEPDVKVIWFRNRYGDKAYNNAYHYQHTTKLPSMCDSLWYADGTKLNFFYQFVNAAGERKVGSMQVYEVMDAYSEVLLGYHISATENYEAQFFAFKMAAQFSGHRPFEIKVDHQGGA